MGDWLYLIIGIAVVAIGLLAGLLTSGRRRKPVEPPATRTDVIAPPRETDVPVADDLLVEEPPAPTVEKPESTASRIVRLRRTGASAGGPVTVELVDARLTNAWSIGF